MARQKQVFPSDEIPHLWAHQSQQSARNAGGRIYFEGDTIFSYGSHFPMARHVTATGDRTTGAGKGARGVLFNSATYSVTTSHHQTMVRRAIPNSFAVFEVPDVYAGMKGAARFHGGTSFKRYEGHRGNLAYYKKQAEKYIGEALRAVHSRNVEWKSETANKYISEAIKYAHFFGLSVPQINNRADDVQARAEYIRQREAIRQTPEWEAKRKAQFEKRYAGLLNQWRGFKANFLASVSEKIAQWRAGESVSLSPTFPASYYSMPRSVRREFSRIEPIDTRAIPTMLRISKDQKDVETSQGARVPVAHAIRGLRFVRSVVQSGKEYQRNGHTFHLGHYAIDRIEANGTLYAGCHVITLAEIELLAPSLESLAISTRFDSTAPENTTEQN